MSLKLGNTTIAGSTIQLGKPLNIGQIVESIIPLSDAGLHLLDGSLIQGGGIYSAFVDYIADIYDSGDYTEIFETEANWQTAVTTYGVCGKFVYDSVNNTVRLPKVTGFIEGASGVANLGDLTEAGLPNITQSDLYLFTYSINDGFIKNTTQSTFAVAGGGGYSGHGITSFTVDASRSNSIYGNSNTVQPQSVKVLYYIVIATTTKTSIEVDIDEVVTDLNGKADVDLTNCTDVANIKMAHNAMPSDTFIDLTLGASGTTYTAPADGYFYLNKTAGSDWYYIQFTVRKTGDNLLLYRLFDSDYRTSPLCIVAPVKKDTVITIDYNATGTTNHFRFIYAQGSESEAQ